LGLLGSGYPLLSALPLSAASVSIARKFAANRSHCVEKRITVSLDERLHRWVQEVAIEDGRPVSAMVRRLIAQAAQNAGRHEPQEHAA
jgi:hypothetical protein